MPSPPDSEASAEPTVRTSTYLLLLGFILLCGALLRFYNLSLESLWRDETISVYLAKQPLWDVLRNRADKSHAPLYFLLLKPWVALFGDSEFAVRSMSAVAGLLAVPMIAITGSALFRDRRVGLLAAALLCISPLHVEYSQETRMYALAVLLALCSTHFLFELLREPTRRRWICYLAATIVLIYEHNSAWFIVGIHNCIVLLRALLFKEKRGPSLRRWGLAQLGLVACFVPWMIMLSVYEGWEPGAREATVEKLTRQVAEPIVAYAGSLQLLIAYAIAVLAGLLALHPKGGGALPRGFFARFKHLRPARDWRPWSLLVWALLPVVILLLLTVAVSMKYQIRYTIVAVAGLYLLAALGISRLPGVALPLGAVGVFTALSIAPLTEHYRGGEKSDWRGAVAYIEAMADSGEVVYVDCTRPERDKKCSWDYYARRDDLKPAGIPVERLKIKGKTRKMPAPKVTERVRFWLLRLDGASYKRHVWWLESAGYRIKRYRKFKSLKVYLLERPPGKFVLPSYERVFEEDYGPRTN